MPCHGVQGPVTFFGGTKRKAGAGRGSAPCPARALPLDPAAFEKAGETFSAPLRNLPLYK